MYFEKLATAVPELKSLQYAGGSRQEHHDALVEMKEA
jgi:hypothetical protein